MDAQKLHIGSHAEKSMICSDCKKAIPAGRSHTYKNDDAQDVHFCDECKKKVDHALTAETKNPFYLGAVLLGVAAALLGGAAWYFFVITTNWEVGYIAIGLGYLIGLAVYFGAKKKRGASLQFLSAGLTLLSLIAAEFFIMAYFLGKDIAAHPEEWGGVSLNTMEIIELFLSDLSAFAQDAFSPISLLIWAVALYVAYTVPKPRAL